MLDDDQIPEEESKKVLTEVAEIAMVVSLCKRRGEANYEFAEELQRSLRFRQQS